MYFLAATAPQQNQPFHCSTSQSPPFSGRWPRAGSRASWGARAPGESHASYRGGGGILMDRFTRGRPRVLSLQRAGTFRDLLREIFGKILPTIEPPAGHRTVQQVTGSLFGCLARPVPATAASLPPGQGFSRRKCRRRSQSDAPREFAVTDWKWRVSSALNPLGALDGARRFTVPETALSTTSMDSITKGTPPPNPRSAVCRGGVPMAHR